MEKDQRGSAGCSAASAYMLKSLKAKSLEDNAQTGTHESPSRAVMKIFLSYVKITFST